MSRQTAKAEGHEKLVANRFGVMTKYIPVATRTRLLHQNSIATLSKSISKEFKKALREQVATKDCMIRYWPATKTKNSVATELSMSRHSDQFGPEFWASTTQLMKCGPTLGSL